jgi:hypothetical protein
MTYSTGKTNVHNIQKNKGKLKITPVVLRIASYQNEKQ